MLRAGDLIDDRFLIEGHAGSGGMGHVYRACDQRTGGAVALKILQRRSAQDLARFEREARALAGLRLPGVVRYIAHGATDAAQSYLAMEWLSGETLSARLSSGALSVADTVALGLRVATTLGAVHRLGLVHRDLKPSNLLLLGGQIERVTMIDFGLARVSGIDQQLTQAGVILGTPGYMAPEQARGQLELDARADVFSFGCVLFKCLTGHAPFQGFGLALLAKVLLEEPRPLRELRSDVPERLEALIARMLSKPPDGRPRDGTALAAELAAIERPETEDAAPRARAAEPVSEITIAERRILCLVTADGGPPLAEATSSETALCEREEALRALAARYGAGLEMVDGRSPLFVLSGAGAATDLAARAAHCALALQAQVGTQVALATGRAELSQRLPISELIDDAFRRLRRGSGADGADGADGTDPAPEPWAPGVEVDEVTAGLLGTRFELSRVRGKIVLHREQRSLDTRPELLGRPTPCVGRDRELALLLAEWDHCVEEHVAGAVLITGAPGLGKSRLRQEFVGLVRERGGPHEIWFGQADPMGAGSAFGLLASAVRRALGLLDGEPAEAARQKLVERVGRHDALAREARRTAAFLGEMLGVSFPDEGDVQLTVARESPIVMSDQIRNAWQTFMRAECSARPVLLVLEDLHWGDVPTVSLIDAALRYSRDRPLMVLALGRPELSEAFPRLWEERTVQRIHLTPLARRAGERLVRAVLGEDAERELVAKLVERAEGNAFFLEEQIRAAVEGRGEGLPEAVLAMVEARLQALEPEARRVLRAASIFGETFWEGGVAALVGGMPVAPLLAELSQREVITRRPRGRLLGEVEYGFRHGLVREAAYGMLPERDRRVGHALAGAWLERAGEGEAIALAAHFEIGGALPRAATMYLRAAEQALRGNDLTAAIDRAERGACCQPEPVVLGALRRVQAEAHIWQGELAMAEERGAEAIALLTAGSSGWYSALVQVVHACGKLGRADAIPRWMQAAQRAQPLDGAERARDICLHSGALQLFLCGRHAEADALLDRTPATLGAVERDVEVAAKHHEVHAYRAMSSGDPGEGAAGLEAALAAYEQAGDRRNACSTRANLGFVYCEIGHIDRAEAALREALDTGTRMGLQDVMAGSQSNLGLVLAQRGQLAEARAMEEAAIATSRTMNHAFMEAMARSYLAIVVFLAGDLEASLREARAAAELTKQIPPAHGRALALQARALLGLGRVAEAREAACCARDTLEVLGTIEEGESLIRLVHVEALAAAGERGEALAALAAAKEALVRRADRLVDPAWRELFLTRVPDNARTLELARAWLEERREPL